MASITLPGNWTDEQVANFRKRWNEFPGHSNPEFNRAMDAAKADAIILGSGFVRLDASGQIERLEPESVLIKVPADPKAPCSHCGKPSDTKHCSVGGCPLGADL